MIPDIELQLKVVIKSLSDNVLPAVDSKNQLALQQAQLSIATLQAAVQNLPYQQRLLREDIQLHCELAESLKDDIDSEEKRDQIMVAMNRCHKALNDPAINFLELQSFARDIRAEIAGLIKSGDIGLKSAYSDVLNTSARCLLLGRSYNKSKGFEPNDQDVPSLESLLNK